MKIEKRKPQDTYRATFKRYTLNELREHCKGRIGRLEEVSALLKELRDDEIIPKLEAGEKSYKEGYLAGFEQSTKAFFVLMSECGLTGQEAADKLYTFMSCVLKKWGSEVTSHETGYAYTSPPIFDLDWDVKPEEAETEED